MDTEFSDVEYISLERSRNIAERNHYSQHLGGLGDGSSPVGSAVGNLGQFADIVYRF